MALPAQPTAGAEYLFRGSPDECLDNAMSYLPDKGYQIEARTESQLTMSRPILTPAWGCIWLIASLFTFGVALLGILAMYWIKRRATVVALPSNNDLTKVTVTWSNTEAKKDLDAWIQEGLGARTRPTGPRPV
jgi:hypothetical protein